ncbi:MAG: hypothetical protein WBF35_06100 [Candidatus Acidiferrales bacterium]
MSPDPSGLSSADPTDPQQLNLYTYVRNNPLILTDPNGLDCVYLNDQGDAIQNVDQDSTADECGSDGGYWFNGTVNQATFQYDPNSDWISVQSSDGDGSGGVTQYACSPGNSCGSDSLNAFVTATAGQSYSVLVYSPGNNYGTIDSNVPYAQTV